MPFVTCDKCYFSRLCKFFCTAVLWPVCFVFWENVNVKISGFASILVLMQPRVTGNPEPIPGNCEHKVGGTLDNHYRPSTHTMERLMMLISLRLWTWVRKHGEEKQTLHTCWKAALKPSTPALRNKHAKSPTPHSRTFQS